MNLKCYIVDDEEHAAQIITSYIEMTEGLELIGVEKNPLNALNKLSGGEIKPDVTFLDIDMPNVSGIELSGLIERHTEIVFTTAFPEYAADAFEGSALDYMLKPVSYIRFLKSINKVRQKFSLLKGTIEQTTADNYFFIKVNTKIIKIIFSDIAYIEAKHNYIEITTRGKPYITYLTLTEVENKLPAETFVRLQKSFIVNIEMIKSIEGNFLTMTDGRDIIVGPTYRKMFQELIRGKLFKTKRKV